MKISRRDYEYLLGVYLGDGTKLNKGNGINIAVGRKVLSYAIDLSLLLEPYGGHIYHDYYAGAKHYHKYCYRVKATDKNFFPDHFVRYKENGVWTLPKLSHPNEFLAGVFDTDGTVRKKGIGQRATNPNNATEVVIYQKHQENLELLVPLFDDLDLFTVPKLHDEKSGMWLVRFSHWTQIKIFSRHIPSRHPLKSQTLNPRQEKVA